MRKVAVPLLAVVATALVCSLAVPTVWAQSNTNQNPAPNSPSAPSQTQPMTPSTQPGTPGTTGTTGQFPTVSNLKPFSAEADFMSLPGYLRYLMYQQTGRWLTYAEARRAVTQQGGQ